MDLGGVGVIGGPEGLGCEALDVLDVEVGHVGVWGTEGLWL